MMLLLAILSAILTVFVYDWTIRKGRMWRIMASQFPGETTLPLLGNAFQLGISAESTHKNMVRLWKKHGMKNFRIMIGTDPLLIITETETAKLILGSNVMLQKNDQSIKSLEEHFGNCLVNADGDRWRVMRKILTPTFNFKLLDKYLEIANAEGNHLIERLKKRVDNRGFDIHEEIIKYTMGVIYVCALGSSDDLNNKIYDEYREASQKVLPLCIKRIYSMWYSNDFIYHRSALAKEGKMIRNIIDNAMDKIIADRKKRFDETIRPLLKEADTVEEFISNNRTNLTFVDIILLSKMPDGSNLSEEDIRLEVNLMIFAGYDTTLSAICFALSNLAKHRECQEKAYQEQVEIFGHDLTREPTCQELNKMKYLKRCLQESMRLYPTVSQFGRHINEDLQLSDGKVIPAGANVMFFTHGFHMNPENFKNPEEFDPDRFLQPVSIYSYLPFSAGPRNCIGMNFAWMSMRSVLSKILRHYELSLESPEHEPQPINEIVLTSKNGFRVKISERNRKL